MGNLGSGRGCFHPKIKYQAQCTQYQWRVIQTFRGGAGDPWGEEAVVVRVGVGELESGRGWGGWFKPAEGMQVACGVRWLGWLWGY